MRVFTDLDDVRSAAGETLGPSPWRTVTQEQVNLFAEATGDHQWIHVDAERAAKGPFGGTIAHGYLTLSLVPAIGHDNYTFPKISMGINYGLSKVRFPAPLRVGSRIRGTSEIIEVTDVPQGMRLTIRTVLEIEDGDKPACVAESLVLLVP